MSEGLRSPRVVLPVLTVLALFFVGLAFWAQQRFTPPLPVLSTLPSFTLTASTGQPFSSEQLKGQPYIVDFIFSRCAGPCPLMSAKLSKLQTATADTPGVKLVSISVDPLADTPAVLAEYAAQYKADPSRWFFLTGEVEPIYTLVEQGFKLPVEKSLDPAKAAPGDLIIHSTRFVLVDGEGQLRGYYDSEAPTFEATLLKDLRTLLAESR